MKTANIFEQEVILHDLLLAGRKGESPIERSFQVLAAELYVKSSVQIQHDFLMHLHQVQDILKNFTDAMITNHIFHASLELAEKGSSGLTENELKSEITWAIVLAKYRTK